VGIHNHDLLSFCKVPISFPPLPLAIRGRFQYWLPMSDQYRARVNFFFWGLVIRMPDAARI
jgi:hypothetical protein